MTEIQWTSVLTRMPELGMTVLTYGGEEGLEVGFVEKSQYDGHLYISNGWHDILATHWMPIPPLSNETGNWEWP